MLHPPGIGLAIALVALLVLAVVVSRVGQLGLQRSLVTASLRAVVQLGFVSLIIAAVLGSLVWSGAFAAAMFVVAVFTSASRLGARAAWPWVALSLGAGVLPVLGIIFASGAVGINGPTLVPLAGIIIGGAMTASSLAGRRAFAALREEHGTYEAALSIGLPRASAITELIGRRVPEALVPGMDQTRTVGLVTLPGAFVGVLLGGGTPIQAGATQLIVLVGLLAAQTITVVSAHLLIRSARLLPTDLKVSLIP